MLNRISLALLVPLAINLQLVQSAEPKPPEGFRTVFNGKDLTGWYGWNPHESAKLTDEKKEANLKKQRTEFSQHWRVEDGELSILVLGHMLPLKKSSETLNY